MSFDGRRMLAAAAFATLMGIGAPACSSNEGSTESKRPPAPPTWTLVPDQNTAPDPDANLMKFDLGRCYFEGLETFNSNMLSTPPQPIRHAMGLTILRRSNTSPLGPDIIGTEIINNPQVVPCVDSGKKVLLLMTGFPDHEPRLNNQLRMFATPSQTAVIEFAADGRFQLRGGSPEDRIIIRNPKLVLTPDYTGEDVLIDPTKQVPLEAFRGVDTHGQMQPVSQATFMLGTPQEIQDRLLNKRCTPTFSIC